MEEFKVLWADDQASFAQMYFFGIKRRFPAATLIEAGDGNEAIEKLKEGVNLIISDWDMPNLSGYEFLQFVRNTPTYKDIPFIMVSGRYDEQSIADAKEAGANEYIIKPFGPREFIDTIARFIDAIPK